MVCLALNAYFKPREKVLHYVSAFSKLLLSGSQESMIYYALAVNYKLYFSVVNRWYNRLYVSSNTQPTKINYW